MNFLKTTIRAMGSLRLSLWLIAAELGLLLAGAVQMPAMSQYSALNSMALFEWMRQAPLRASWWLWASVAVMSLMTLNTLICSAESIIRKRQGRQWLLTLSPQLIHIGFLLMLAGHLVSAAGAVHLEGIMAEGSTIKLPSGQYLRLGKVSLAISPQGYPLDWWADLEYYSPRGDLVKRGRAAPNSPSFSEGMGIYIKQAAYGKARMEVHREPGAPWALLGGALFTLGTIALAALKIQRER